MKWKDNLRRLNLSLLMSYRNALQEKTMIMCMPGIYRRNWNEGNCRIIEKVMIKKISVLGDIYKIIQITWKGNSFDNTILHKQKVDKWIACYDNSTKQLEEVGEEKRKCSFFPERLLLLMSGARYKRIKN